MSKLKLITRGMLLAAAIMLGANVHAQEIEPNNACLAPQDLGAVALPTSIFGELESTPETPDIDFFRGEAIPGELILVDLEGASTGVGTLSDPFLGVFDSGCAQLAIDDDRGSGLNSRLSFEVPADGVFVLGATACCDYAFVGGGQGTYRLTLSRLAAIESISGRIVNDMTGEPLPGTDIPYSSVQLLRCNEDGCFEFVNFQQADMDGLFIFDSDQFGNPLTVGTYQLYAFAQGYEQFFSEPFDVTEGEARNVGELRLVPLQLIGSVSGRLVDAIDGTPLSGFNPPFPFLYLQRCEDSGCFIVAGANPDEFGRFRFEGVLYFLAPGTYQVTAFAEDYRESNSARFNVGVFEHVDIGDLPLTPFPIRFGAVQPCEIPPGGGLCEYGIEVTNRGPGRYKGATWSSVDLYSAPFFRVTRFQVGKIGARHPAPQQLNLKQGQSEMLTFQLEVPASVADGSFVCANVAVGSNPDPQFNSQGDRPVFCATKQSGGFEVLSEKEARKQLRKLKNQDRRGAGSLTH